MKIEPHLRRVGCLQPDLDASAPVDARIPRVPDGGGRRPKVRCILRPRHGRDAEHQHGHRSKSFHPSHLVVTPTRTRAPTCQTSAVDPFSVGPVTRVSDTVRPDGSGTGNCADIVRSFMPGGAEVVNVAPTSAGRPARRLCVTASDYGAALGEARFFNGLDGPCDAWMLE